MTLFSRTCFVLSTAKFHFTKHIKVFIFSPVMVRIPIFLLMQKDPASLIPFNSNNGGYYQNHTVAMFDLLEKRYTDAVIQPRREEEIQACCEMIDRNPISGKCCFIADRSNT